MTTDTREALAALMVIAAECAQRKPLRGFEELTEAIHIGHRQFGRAHEKADEDVRMLAVRLRAVFDTLAAALATQPAQPRQWDEFGRTNAGDETGGAVQRFGFDISGSKPDIIPATNGAFVYYSDYLALHRKLAAQPSAQGEEVAWLVEWKAHGHGPQWWGFNHTPGKNATWCSDANNAIRFARKEDAERMRLHIIAVAGLTGMHEYERNVSVTENLWEVPFRAE